MAFTKEGELLLADSRDCGVEDENGELETSGWEWEEYAAIVEAAKEVCCGEGVELIRSHLAKDRTIMS